MEYDFNKRKLKAKMTWEELMYELDLARKDPAFRALLKQFMKETTS